jgi:hypothetical protein
MAAGKIFRCDSNPDRAQTDVHAWMMIVKRGSARRIVISRVVDQVSRIAQSPAMGG